MSKELDQMATLFRALGDPTRLRILGLLMTGEVCVCDIHESLRIPQPKASRHLAYLRRTGLVDTRRDGLWIHYRLARVTGRQLAAVTEAVRQALVQVEDVHKDAARLQRSTSCCTAAPLNVSERADVGARTVPVTVVRSRADRGRS